MKGENKYQSAEFIEEFARKCIDEGAHAIIGHGPHVLRGIEIYKNRPIFYSLGNFIFQNDTVNYLPSDFYEKYNVPQDKNVPDALSKRSKQNTKGLGTNPYVWESVIANWKMESGELKELTLHPIELGYGMKSYQRGWPILSSNDEILYRLQELSKPYGTSIKVENHVGLIND